MNTKTALITGHGMDSKTLCHILLKKGYHVTLTYRRHSNTNNSSLLSIYSEELQQYPNSTLELKECEITSRSSVENVLRDYQYDEVYLLAAQSHVGYSFNNPEYNIAANGTSVYYFLDYLHKHNRNARIYHACTSELYGGSDGALNENSPFHPRSPYAIGKAQAYYWMQHYKDMGMHCSCGILFNHSNQYRSVDFAVRKITSAAAQIAAGNLSTLKLAHLDWYRDEHYSDLGCLMMYRMLQQPSPDNYVIGTGTAHHSTEFLECAFGKFGLSWDKYVELDSSLCRPNEVTKLCADSLKAQKVLGWNPNQMEFRHHIGYMCDYDYSLAVGKKPKRLDVLSLYGLNDNIDNNHHIENSWCKSMLQC